MEINYFIEVEAELPLKVWRSTNTRKRSTKFMFQLIETIRLHDGQFGNLGYHEQRMHRAMKEIFGVDRKVNLEEVLSQYSKPTVGLYKCRLVYDNKGNEVEF